MSGRNVDFGERNIFFSERKIALTGSDPLANYIIRDFPTFRDRRREGWIRSFFEESGKNWTAMLKPFGVRFQRSRAPKRANKASRRTDPFCLEFQEYEDVDASKIDLLRMSASIGEINKMKISLFIFMNFTGEIIKSDDRPCHYLCYRSSFPANDRRCTPYRTEGTNMTTDHIAGQIKSQTFLKTDVVALPALRTCNLVLVWQTTLPSSQLSRIS